MADRDYKLSVLKKLFAMTCNKCAMSDCTEQVYRSDWKMVNADICHIEGLNEGSARYNPRLTNQEANDYPNLIVMCPTHHRYIDDLEPEKWTVEKLVKIKFRQDEGCPGTWADERTLNAVVAMVAVQYHLQLPPEEHFGAGAINVGVRLEGTAEVVPSVEPDEPPSDSVEVQVISAGGRGGASPTELQIE